MHTSLLAFDVHSWLPPISTPGSSHSWPPCVKREVGEGAALLLSQMRIPQLKWKIHLLSVRGALPASSQQVRLPPPPTLGRFGSQNLAFRSLIFHLLTVVLSQLLKMELPFSASASGAALSIYNMMAWKARVMHQVTAGPSWVFLSFMASSFQ